MKKAFTLIELLVVIAIIAILAAILFPVFAQAKAAAKKTQALSNIKQTNLGILIYTNDTDDNFPIGSGASWYYPDGSGGWAWDTTPYIKSLPLLLDPSDPKSHVLWQTWMTPPQVVSISMAANAQVKWSGTANEMSGVIPMIQSWYPSNVVPTTAVTKPAETIMLADSFYHQNIWGGGDILSDVTSWDFTAPQALPNGTRNGQPYTVTANGSTITVNANNQNGAVATVYANTGVFSFCDGHAKAMNPVATNPNEQSLDTADTKDMWNALRS